MPVANTGAGIPAMPFLLTESFLHVSAAEGSVRFEKQALHTL